MASNIDHFRDLVTSMAEQIIYFKTGERSDNQHKSLDKTSSAQNFMKFEYLK